MQSLYLLGQRQINAIQSDVATLTAVEPSLTSEPVDRAALNGQLVASLSALQRTIDDYENLSKRELVQEKRDKAET